MLVNVAYTSQDPLPVDVSVVLKNSLDQTLCIVGSYTAQVTPPIPKNGAQVRCTIAVRMAVEAGMYSVEVKLGSSPTRINTGELLDQVTIKETIRVNWDYQTRKPPFFGMVGLPHRVSFH
jgi:hypothetical protein